MRIGLFPFTYITEQVAEACYSCLGQITLYQPVAGQAPLPLPALAENGKIDLKAPVTGMESQLVTLCRDFNQWGQMYQGDAAVLKKIAEGGFYNEQFIPEIRSEILKGGAKASHDPDPVFNARLFLLLAQQFDSKNAEIDRELQAAQHATRDLFAEITGEFEASGQSPSENANNQVRRDDQGAHMTESRLWSWFCLLCADSAPPDVLVTTSPEVVAALEERYETMALVGQYIFSDAHSARQLLYDTAISGTTPDEPAVLGSRENKPVPVSGGYIMDVYLLPEHPPWKLAKAFTEQGDVENAPDVEIRHGVIGCLRPVSANDGKVQFP